MSSYEIYLTDNSMNLAEFGVLERQTLSHELLSQVDQNLLFFINLNIH